MLRNDLDMQAELSVNPIELNMDTVFRKYWGNRSVEEAEKMLDNMAPCLPFDSIDETWKCIAQYIGITNVTETTRAEIEAAIPKVFCSDFSPITEIEKGVEEFFLGNVPKFMRKYQSSCPDLAT